MENFKTLDPCTACKKETEGGNCLHHLYTKKAYPQYKFELWNLIPVCQRCHNLFHNMGISWMASESYAVKDWLIKNGWEIFNNKWIRSGNE